jgi:hypothetical protein
MAIVRERLIDDDLRYFAWRCGMARRVDHSGRTEPPHGQPATPPVRIPADTSKLYHLVPASDAHAVIRDGIHANCDGLIYCFTDPRAAEVIAREQLFARRYALFEIDLDGLVVGVEADVAVWIWEPYQRVVRQSHVKPEFLLLVGVYELSRVPSERDYRRGERWGWSRERTKVIFDLSDRFVSGEINTDQVNQELRRLRHQYNQAQNKNAPPLAISPHGAEQRWDCNLRNPTSGYPGAVNTSAQPTCDQDTPPAPSSRRPPGQR